MADSKGNFAEGSIAKSIMSLALPITVAELVNILYNIVDRIYIGHIAGIGTDALTGVGVALPLITLVSAFAALLGVGGAPLFNIARGEGDNERARLIMETAFTMLLSCSFILIIILFPIRAWVLSLLGGLPQTLPYAVSYSGIYLLGTPFVLIALGMNTYINAQGYSKMGMYTIIIGAALNIILDPLFIFAFKMDVRGAAIATVISQAVSAGWVARFLIVKAPISIKRLKFNSSCALNIIKLGIVGFVMKITNSLTQAVINVTLKSWGGDLASMYIASASIIGSLREVTWLPLLGIVEGFKPVASFNYGARLYNRVSESIKVGFIMALCSMTVMWSLIQGMPKFLIGLFTPDVALIEHTVPCLRAFFACYVLMAFMNIAQNTFIALNMPKFAIFFSINRKVILVVPLTILLPYTRLGVMGAFWAEALSQVTGAMLCFIVMCLVVWRHLGNWEEYQAEKAAKKAAKKKFVVRKDY